MHDQSCRCSEVQSKNQERRVRHRLSIPFSLEAVFLFPFPIPPLESIQCSIWLLTQKLRLPKCPLVPGQTVQAFRRKPTDYIGAYEIWSFLSLRVPVLCQVCAQKSVR